MLLKFKKYTYLLFLFLILISSVNTFADIAFQRYEYEFRPEYSTLLNYLDFTGVYDYSGDITYGLCKVDDKYGFAWNGDSAIELKSENSFEVNYFIGDTTYISSGSGIYIAHNTHWHVANPREATTIVIDIKFEEFNDSTGYVLMQNVNGYGDGSSQDVVYVRNGHLFWHNGINDNTQIKQIAFGGGYKFTVMPKYSDSAQILYPHTWYRIIVVTKDVGYMLTEYTIFVNAEEIVKDTVNQDVTRPNTPIWSVVKDIGLANCFIEDIDGHIQSTYSTVKRFAVFDMAFSKDDAKQLQPWDLLKNCADCNGEFKVPEIYAILYDPPGDQSYCELIIDSASENVTTISRSENNTEIRPAGFYTMMDSSRGNTGDKIWDIGMFAFDGLLNGLTVTNTRETKNTTTYSSILTKSRTFRSKQEDEFANHIGQDNGTIFAIQENKWAWTIGRRLKNGLEPDTIPIDGEGDTIRYEYTVLQRPLKSSPDIVVMSLQDLVAHYSDTSQQDSVNKQQAFVNAILEAIAIDTQTGRVKQEFVDSGLINIDGGRLNLSSTALDGFKQEEKTEAFSYSLTISMEESKVRQLDIFGLITSGEYGFSQTYTNTNSTSSSSTVLRKASYYINDDEPWDKFNLQAYWDNRFGTWLFDVLDSTYTSLPYESKYSEKSVDWEIIYSDTSKNIKQNDTAIYTLNFLNTSNVNDILLDSLKISNSFESSLIGATVIFSNRLEVRKGDTLTQNIRITSDFIGIDTTVLELHLLRPSNDWNETYVETKTITFITDFREVIKELSLNSDTLHFEVPSDQTMPVIHNFYATIINNGEQTESLDIGVSTFSTGVTVALSTLEDSIKAGDTAKVTIGLTGQASYYPFTADFYAQISGESNTRKTITFVIDTLPGVGVESKTSPRLLLAGEVSWQSLFTPSTLKWRVGGNKDFKFNIYDCAGRMVSSIKTKNQLGLWNTSGKSSGIYFIKWTYENKSYSKKLVLFH